MVLILTKIETELNLIYYSSPEAGILAAQGVRAAALPSRMTRARRPDGVAGRPGQAS